MFLLCSIEIVPRPHFKVVLHDCYLTCPQVHILPWGMSNWAWFNQSLSFTSHYLFQLIWILKTNQFQLNNIVIFMTQVHPTFLSFLATCCLHIAAKSCYEHDSVALQADEILYLSRCGGSVLDLYNTERLICETLQWHIDDVTSLTFLQLFYQVFILPGFQIHLKDESFALITAKLEVLLCNFDFTRFRVIENISFILYLFVWMFSCIFRWTIDSVPLGRILTICCLAGACSVSYLSWLIRKDHQNSFQHSWWWLNRIF